MWAISVATLRGLPFLLEHCKKKSIAYTDNNAAIGPHILKKNFKFINGIEPVRQVSDSPRIFHTRCLKGIRPLETLHNCLSLHQLDSFLDLVTNQGCWFF